MKDLPPIEIVKLYMSEDKNGPFTLKAKELPSSIWNKMTDQERIERMNAERKAINAEWDRIRGVN